MKRMVFYSIFLVILTSLLSCEGSRYGHGIIYDKSTNVPLDSVKYKNTEGTYIQYTDSTGEYHISGRFGGCLPDCPDFDAEFSKKGYKTKIITNPDGNIYLEKK